MMPVVTLGPAGTYSHRAATAVAPDVEFRDSVTDVVDAVLAEGPDRGVVPIENSIEGSVTESLDAFTERDVCIVGELVAPIRHALVAQGSSFETVASHPQALAQCRSYLETTYPEVSRESVASTAEGVERARADPSVAAIAHPDTADGPDGALAVLATDIQDRPSNATRFLVVAPGAERSATGEKTSIVVYPDANYPGLLLELLEPFAERDINLSRVESRPSGRRLGDYVFHVDFEAGLAEAAAEEAVAELESIAESGWVRRLGSYDSRHVET